MARFLLAVWPIPGHYYPNLTVAHALRRRGHDVAFLSGTRARDVIEREGFPCFTFHHVDERSLDRIFFAPQASRPWWKPPIVVQRARARDWLVGLLPGQVADVEDAVAAWKPDVIVCDPTLWGVLLVAPERLGIPVAVFVYVPFSLAPGPEVPPLGFGLPAPSNGGGRLRLGAARMLFQLATGRFREAANDLRRQHGLSPIDGSVSEFALTLPLYLIAGTPEVDFDRRDLPPSAHYVGPCIWERPRSGPPPEWLGTRRRDQAWVHVTEGTIHTQRPLLARAAAQGLADMPVQVIIATSAPGDGESLGIGPIAPNTQLEHWVNIHYSELLPRTDVVVATGGAGTVLSALRAGVPVILVPTEWDKPDVAARIVATGAGLRLSPSECTPRRLRTAVERVLGDPSFRQNARRLAAAFEGYRGPDEAARLLEDLGARVRPAEERLVTAI
jgi:MGT family glycosyltransferase